MTRIPHACFSVHHHGHLYTEEDPLKGPRFIYPFSPALMSSSYQKNIFGNDDFQPPRYNVRAFLDLISIRRPKLLDPHRHGELLIAFAHYVGLEPDKWSRHIGPIAWLLKISPDIERACRKYRADAF